MRGTKWQVLLLFSVCCIWNSIAQEPRTQYVVELQTTQATKNTVPFWLYANTYGTVPQQRSTMLYTAIAGKILKPTQYFNWEYKIGTTAYTAEKNALFIDELYSDVQYKSWGLTLGIKRDAQQMQGLSSSNGTITKSTNARAYPGYNLYLKHFVPLPFVQHWLSVKGNYGDYVLNDKRSVQNARLHSKSLFIKYKLNPSWEVITGLNHYAQWAGTSDVFGKQPRGFKNYLRVITGSSGGSDALGTDQINVLGNQLGSYQLQVQHTGEKITWQSYYSHIFEDRSGREMMNYPDALYGLSLIFKKAKPLVKQLVLEYTYTKNVSGNAPHYTDENGIPHAASGMDNYFNNGVYQSGWTYFGNIIGSPYFTTKPVDADGITRGIIDGDNRFMALNIGASGTFKKVPYSVLVSHTTYVGWFGTEYDPRPTQFSGVLAVELSKMIHVPFEVRVGTAFDTGTYRPVNFGGFIKISKSGFF